MLGKRLELELNKKTMVIGSDHLRTMFPILSIKFIPEREEIIRKLTLNLIKLAIDFNDIVINDDMNYYKSMRHDLYKIAGEKKSNFFIIEFQIDLKTALKWNEKRGTPIPQKLIKEVAEKFDTLGSYFWDIPIITIHNEENSSDENVNLILKILKDKLDAPQIINEKKLVKNKPGKSEYYDKLTRKLVSEIILQPKYNNKRNEILQLRKEIFFEALKNDLDENKVRKLFLDKVNELI